MTQPEGRRTYAAVQANWARVAGGVKSAVKEQESARQLSNKDPGAVTEWQRWLLDHLDSANVDVQQAIGLAEMWVKVAAVQPSGSDAPV
jgi:hypothetical protein